MSEIRELVKQMPKRASRKIMVTLPEDQIAFIDACARAVSMHRSTFLQVYFDLVGLRQLYTWTDSWLEGSQLKIVPINKPEGEEKNE